MTTRYKVSFEIVTEADPSDLLDRVQEYAEQLAKDLRDEGYRSVSDDDTAQVLRCTDSETA